MNEITTPSYENKAILIKDLKCTPEYLDTDVRLAYISQAAKVYVTAVFIFHGMNKKQSSVLCTGTAVKFIHNIYIYIFIYVWVCVCVCIHPLHRHMHV